MQMYVHKRYHSFSRRRLIKPEASNFFLLFPLPPSPPSICLLPLAQQLTFMKFTFYLQPPPLFPYKSLSSQHIVPLCYIINKETQDESALLLDCTAECRSQTWYACCVGITLWKDGKHWVHALRFLPWVTMGICPVSLHIYRILSRWRVHGMNRLCFTVALLGLCCKQCRHAHKVLQRGQMKILPW